MANCECAACNAKLPKPANEEDLKFYKEIADNFWKGREVEDLRAEVETLRRERDELLEASEKAVSEMKATAWDEEGYCLDPDLDESADELAAAIAKVKP